jgi:hypothetical protein
MAPPLVFFIHVPKTAGTALKLAFRQAVGDRLVWFGKHLSERVKQSPIRHIDNFDDVPPAQLKQNFRVLGGHMTFGDLPEALVQLDPVFVSLMRDPLSRALSFYNYIQTNKHHILNKKFADLTFYEALMMPEFRSYVNNQQLRFLCGTRNRNRLDVLLKKHKFIIGKFEKLAAFQNAVEQHADVRLSLKKPTANSGADGYKQVVAAQPDYKAALQEVAALTAGEREFYESFDDVLLSRRARVAPDRMPSPAVA